MQGQRDELWRRVFGEAPLTAITSPFMLAPQKALDSSNTGMNFVDHYSSLLH